MSTGKKWIGLAVLVGVLAVLGAKGARQGWFTPRTPLELGDEPALLFFNNDRGCECVLVIYQRADAEIASWPAAERQNVPVHRINLERRPDLGEQYDIVRAPTLLLLDGAGRELWRQDEVITDLHVFDLQRFEKEIAALVGAAP